MMEPDRATRKGMVTALLRRALELLDAGDVDETITQTREIIETALEPESPSRGRKTSPFPTRVCRECGSKFYITTADQAFYYLHQYALPNHCLPCRAKRREAKSLKEAK